MNSFKAGNLSIYRQWRCFASVGHAALCAGLVGISSAVWSADAQVAGSAFVGANLEFTGFSAAFAERSTLFQTGNLSVWQGGSVGYDGGSVSGRWDIALGNGVAPLVGTSATGVQYSQPILHSAYVSPGTTKVTFADRLGWLIDTGPSAGYRYAAFDTAPTRDNWISFVPASPSYVSLGDTFLLGTFEVRNGSWHSENNGGPGPVLIPFTLRSESIDPAFHNHSLSGTFAFQVHADGSADPVANADEFWIVELPQLGSARVIEGQTGRFEVWGSINSLHIDALRNADGGVVLTPFVGAVPEPGAWVLWLAGLPVLGLKWYRRRASC